MKRTRRVARIALLLLAVAAVGYGALWAAACSSIGGNAKGARLERVKASAQWHADSESFRNKLARVDGPWSEMMSGWFFGGQPHRTPDEPVVVEQRTAADYEAAPSSGLRVTWLGHSTLLLEIDGARVLIDPVWGERASPFSWAGPERFFAPPLPFAELPPVDVVVISHDHYDHLDAPTVERFAMRDRPPPGAVRTQWAVPLGVGADLESWGISTGDIHELDWWEHVSLANLKLTAVPARHFSGRWLDDADQTLWSGWVVAGAQHRVYYSGDTALFPELKDIGARLGPFDLTMIEVGAYDQLWADVHLGPEQAVRAHRLVNGNVLLPVHWGLFDLALHGWTEPMERTLAAATKEGVRVIAPKPGGRAEPAVDAREPKDVARWWPDVAWRTVDQAPAYSSGVDELLRGTAPPPPSP